MDDNLFWNIRCRPLFFPKKVEWQRNLIVPVECEDKGVKRHIKIEGDLLGHFLYAIYNFYNAPITLEDLVHHSDDGLNKSCKELLESGEQVCWADLMGDKIWFHGIKDNQILLTE